MPEISGVPSEDAKSVAKLEHSLNQLILTGRIMEGYELFYAEDIVIQELSDEPCRGKDANRQRQNQFLGLVQEVHSVKLLGGAIADNQAYSEWEYDITFKDGLRYLLSEVAVREWADGRVVRERFYWDRSKYPYEL